MRRFSLVALGVAVFTAVFGALALPAWADKSIQATLQSCPAGQVMTAGTFTMTGVTNPGQQITVNTTAARSYAPSSFGNNIATYNIPSFDAPVRSAQATVPNTWMGSFSLSNPVCTAAKAPTISPSVALCNMTPVNLIVGLKNNNPLLVTYTVSLTGLPTKTIDLGAGEAEDVDFVPLTRGTTYTLTVSGAGVSSSQQIAVDSCAAPPPGPAPTTKAPAKTAVPSTTPEATLVAQPSVSASNDPSTSPTPSDDQTPSDKSDSGPFDADGSWTPRPWVWIVVVIVFIAILVLIFVIFGMRN